MKYDSVEVRICDEDSGEVFFYSEYFPRACSDDVVKLIGYGLAYEHDWIPGSVNITITRFTPYERKTLENAQLS